MEHKQKLVNIINDLEADNLFNKDTENRRNIAISIEALKKELNITQEELTQDLKTR